LTQRKLLELLLIDAVSVAALLTTTEAMITDKPEDKSGPSMPDMGGMGGMGGGMPGMMYIKKNFLLKTPVYPAFFFIVFNIFIYIKLN
jgi:hypothetical protein